MSLIRSRWAALGAAVAITLGAGGIGLVSATNPAGALTFIPITPCRVIDTRPAPDNVGPKTSPLGPRETHTVKVHGTNGNCTGIPTTAAAVSLNVTAVGATQPTFLTIWANGTTRPEASSLNPTPGQPPTPNAVTTNVDTNGRFNIYNLAGNVHVLADINGYYTNHNHDDRYYTKNQVNSRIQSAIDTQAWSVSMPISNALWTDDSSRSWTIASGGSTAPNGLTLHDVGYGRFWHGFTLPPAYVPGDEVVVHISWMADTDNAVGCMFMIEDNGTNASRANQPFTSVATEFDGGVAGGFSSPYVILTATNEGSLSSWSDNTVHDARLVLSGTDLQPGTNISLAIARRADPSTASQDSCTGGITILAMSADAG